MSGLFSVFNAAWRRLRWLGVGACWLGGVAQGAEWNPFQLAGDVRRLRAESAAVAAELARVPEARVVAQAHQRIGYHGRARSPAVILLDLGRVVQPEEIVLMAARVSDPLANDPQGAFPPEVRCLIAESDAAGEFTLLAEWREPKPGAGRDLPLLRLRCAGAKGRFLKVEILGGRERGGSTGFALGEVVVLEGGVNRALGAKVIGGAAVEIPPRWTAANLTDGFLWCGMFSGVATSAMNGFHSAIEKSVQAVPKWVEVDFGEAVRLDEIRLVPARPGNFADVAGFGFPPAFEVIAFADESQSSERVIFSTENVAFPNPGDAMVCLPARGVLARRVRVVATALWERTSDFIFALAELQAFSGGRNVALGKAVRASDVTTTKQWSQAALVDGFGSQRELLDWPAWLAAMERRSELETRRAQLGVRLAATEAILQRALWRSSSSAVMLLLLGGGALLIALQWRQRRERETLRRRIAQDLHDEVGSQLGHLALLADTGAELSGIARETRDLQHTMRDLVWLLDPQSGEARDFTARLRQTCQRLLAPARIEVRIESAGEPPPMRLPLTWSRDVLLFVKEALHNCAAHSQAKSAAIRLEWSPVAFTFTLSDDGIGFDESAPDFTAGAGLRNLRARAQALKAECEIASTNGTRVWLRAPLPVQPWWRRFFISNT